MKRIAALLTALVCAVLCVGAMAEAPQSVSPLLQLYRAEQALLFSTDNVTMTGHAVFKADGQIFKTAELTHIQDGITSARDWRLVTPSQLTGIDRETGYTVVTQGNDIYAYESYLHSKPHYVIDSSLQRTSILRHTIISDTLSEMAELLLSQCGGIGEASMTTDENGQQAITIHIGENDFPPVLNALLNSVLQYGINRYTGYNYASEIMVSDTSYTFYNTIAQGLIFCLKSVQLRDLSLQAVLDPEQRLLSVSCEAVLAYTQKIDDVPHELSVVFEQTACDYGTSQVNDDPQVYDHWDSTALPNQHADIVPSYTRSEEIAAAQQLLEGLYWAPQDGTHLHADPNCASVNPNHRPMDKAALSIDLLMNHDLCAFCVDPSPFLDELGNASLDMAAGDLMAALTYDEDYGMNELNWDLDLQYGYFENWSPALKHRLTAMLPALAEREKERMQQYHPEYAPDTRLREMMGIWSYGMPEEGADAAAKEAAAAYALGKGLLTKEQLGTLTVTCNYYTSSSFVTPFTEPWWVIRYADKNKPVCEVWLDNSLSKVHGVDTPRLVSIAQDAVMAQKPQLGMEPVTLDMLKAFEYHIIYIAEDQQWNCVFDSGSASYWFACTQDDDALTLIGTESGNG